MEARPHFRGKRPVILLGTAILLGLYAARIYNFLLFHVLAETFSVVVAFSVFLVAWNARRSQENHYFLFVGIGYLFSGGLDLLHMVAYRGMGVFPGHDANLATQLWVGARYLQAISLLASPRFADRALDPGAALAGFGAAACLLIASVFAGVFPDCHVEGVGLTPFKIYSEYAVCAILLASMLHLRAKRSCFDGDVLHRLGSSILVAIGAELLFTLYRDVYGVFNLLGHFLKILSVFLVYRAAIGIDFSRKLELTGLLKKQLTERKRAEESNVRAKEQWERTFDSVQDLIAIVDDQHRILRVNAAMARRLGIVAEQCKGLFCYEQMHGTSEPPAFCPHSKTLADGRPHFEELRVDRFESDFLVSTSPLFDEKGRKIGSVHVAHDITERKRAEEEVRAAKEDLEKRVAVRTWELRTLADRLQDELSERRRAEENLRQSEERFRAVVEHSPVGIFIVRDGRIVYRNPEQARLFGPLPEEFELREFRDIHPEDAPDFEKLCAAVTGDLRGAREMDLRFYPYERSAEGTDLRWVHIRTTPMEYEGKKSVLVSMVDITRHKEMEHQLLTREKLASLGHVAAGIAHEIRNPLSGINIHLSALERIHEDADALEAGGREQAAKVVRQIQSASERIESVIRKVMDFSRPSAIRPDSADLLQAIERAVEFTATLLRRERITLDRSRLCPLPKCSVDPSLITQVVMNLIVNAAQAMEKIDGKKVVGISSSLEGDRIVVCVSDSGPGIPPALRDRIFDPFFTTRKDGYGIGLSFCRRVISEHGGILNVGTGPLGGAEFRIEIPIARQEALV